jgi:hypothetical protein
MDLISRILLLIQAFNKYLHYYYYSKHPSHRITMNNKSQLTLAFLSRDSKEFEKALQEHYETSGGCHPRFDCGLLFFDEFVYYIGALKRRNESDTEQIREYLDDMGAMDHIFSNFKWVKLKPLEQKTKDEILKPGYKDDFGNHAIIAAVQTCDVILLKSVIELYPSLINEQGLFGDRALDHACILLDYDMAKVLIENGANPNAKSAFNGTPFKWLLAAVGNYPSKTNIAQKIYDLFLQQ